MGLWGDLWLENTVSESLCPWPDISGSSDGRDPVKCERDSLRFPTRASYWPQGRQRVSRWRPAGLLFSPRSGLLKSFLRQEGPQTQLEWPTRHTAETSQLSSSSVRGRRQVFIFPVPSQLLWSESAPLRCQGVSSCSP